MDEPTTFTTVDHIRPVRDPVMSARADQLRDATLDMTSRYGDAVAASCVAPSNIERRRHHRAAMRRYRALMRLTAALRDEVRS